MRGVSVDDALTDGLSFDFCKDSKSFRFENNLWMSYFAALQYSHFKDVAPRLEKLGFGNPGEGRAYLKRWYDLRLARVSAGVKDVDDTWKDEAGRLQRLQVVTSEYKAEFGSEADLAPKSPEEVTQEAIGVHDDGRKIVFISGKFLGNSASKKEGTTQVLYAEHRSLDFAVAIFRGTEQNEVLDIAADLVTNHSPIPENPGKIMFGFLAAYAEVDQDVMALLNLRLRKNPSLQLWAGGHSLGGALATIFSARVIDLSSKGKLNGLALKGVYTFGSPRVGNDVFAIRYDATLQKLNIPVFRVRNYRDMVTGIPFGAPGTSGYWHVGSLVYYDAKGKLHHAPGWKTIEQQSDIKAAFPTSGDDHSIGKYFDHALAAYSAAGTSRPACRIAPSERASAPFAENPKARVKSWEALAEEYGVLADIALP
jgi:hypothetical protein